MKVKVDKDKFLEVDAEYGPLLAEYNWHIGKFKNTFYAYRYRQENKKSIKTYLHREIMGAEKGKAVDHINRNGLDNRKSNLRYCTQSQNNQNSCKKINKSSSKYKGVYWSKAAKKWAAYINSKKNRAHLGLYRNEKDAALAYDKKAKELFGEFARLNIKTVKKEKTL